MRHKDSELMYRIRDYLDHYIIENQHAPTQREVAAAMHISPSSAHRYLTAMGEEEMISYDHKVIGTELSEKCSSDFVSAPIVSSIECSDPEAETEYVEEYVNLPVSIFGEGEIYILHAEGTSMVDAGIWPGDLVVVRKQDTAEIGDIVVALDDNNQNTLRRYGGQDPDTGKAVLLYENKEEYPGKRILVDELVIRGVVRQSISGL